MNKEFHKQVSIRIGNVELGGELTIPDNSRGIVIFSHGSGSSRFSPRNRMVARYLHQYNFATLLFDLLTPEEDLLYSNRFDIDLLSGRLIAVTNWLQKIPEASGLQPAYFGASTGAASALKAASLLPRVAAIVSRGGRPDLAGDRLSKVSTPTLLIVGSRDTEVLQLNEEAYQQLAGIKELQVVEGATHLFEEPGTMETVCELAARWFEKYATLSAYSASGKP
jgi:putative phosphoribosyl transferase